MIAILIGLIAVTIAVWVFLQQPKFGKLPSGERLERIKKSPHFKDGKFQNLSVTPDLTEGVTYYEVMKEFLFAEKVRNKPVDKIPATKTDLSAISTDEHVLVWFGHSSYFLQVDGKKILVDPVLSGTASPLAFTTRSFPGTDVYTADDIPEIDYLIISHDHWDHLDYETLKALKPKIKQVICGLGNGEHLEHWGYSPEIIIEKDWNETVSLDPDFTIYTAPARHFSGRSLSRNRSLWMSFILEAPSQRIYIGGDSGYDGHFTSIGNQFQSFDLVILENGQYDKSWKYIHLMPEEVIQAAQDLKAKKLLTVHSSKFALGNHPWDEPLIRVFDLAEKSNVNLITPIIGEKVLLNDSTQKFRTWWSGVE